MSNLKEKFGKFELGKAQVKGVKGGSDQQTTVTCWVRTETGRRIVGIFSLQYVENAVAIHGSNPDFLGCW
jgi:hypothetical protein